MKTSAIVAAFERLVDAVRKHHPELPEVTFLLSRGNARSSANGGYRLGTGEIWIAAHHLWDGAHLVAQTVLHELAHALADVRGVRACSGRAYHNGKFAAFAEELGLTRLPTRDRTRGWAGCTLEELTARRYRAEIEALAVVLPEARDKRLDMEPAAEQRPMLPSRATVTPERAEPNHGMKLEGRSARTGALHTIAKQHLHIKTLETRGRDDFDFHAVPVWGLRAALEAAYRAGAASEIRRLEQPPSAVSAPKVIGTTTRYIGNEIPGLDQVTICAIIPRQILAKELGIDVHREGYCVMDDQELQQRGGVTKWDRVVVTYVDPERQETFAAEPNPRALDLEAFTFLRE